MIDWLFLLFACGYVHAFLGHACTNIDTTREFGGSEGETTPIVLRYRFVAITLKDTNNVVIVNPIAAAVVHIEEDFNV